MSWLNTFQKQAQSISKQAYNASLNASSLIEGARSRIDKVLDIEEAERINGQFDEKASNVSSSSDNLDQDSNTSKPFDRQDSYTQNLSQLNITETKQILNENNAKLPFPSVIHDNLTGMLLDSINEKKDDNIRHKSLDADCIVGSNSRYNSVDNDPKFISEKQIIKETLNNRVNQEYKIYINKQNKPSTNTSSQHDKSIQSSSISKPNSTISSQDAVSLTEASPFTELSSQVPEMQSSTCETDKTKELLSKREQQLATLAKSNATLQEQNDNLSHEKSVLSNELQNMLKENQTQKSEIQKLLDRASTSEQLTKLLADKEESIRGLLAEGEKLSKQQMSQQQANKKLRIKNKEYETEMAQTLTKCNNAENETNKLREQLKEITEREMREREQGRRMNSTVDQQSSEIQNLQFKLNEALEKQRSLQSTADSAYKEMTDLNKQMHEITSNHNEQLDNLRQEKEEETNELYNKAKKDYENEKSMLLMQISDANSLIERNEATSHRRENALKIQITDLQNRLQEAEQRQSELSTAMTASTRPLLRQLEQIQSAMTQQQTSADEVEKSLTNRLREVQGEVSAQKERQRQAVEAAMDAHSKTSALEASILLIKEEKIRLEKELDEIKNNYDILKSKEEKQRHELEKLHGEQIKESENYKSKTLILQQQLDQERTKLQTAMEGIKEKERQWALLGRNESAISRTTSLGYEGPRSECTSEADTLGPAPGDAESISELSDIRNENEINSGVLLDQVISKTTTYEAVAKSKTIKSSNSSSTPTNSTNNGYTPQVLSTNVFESMQAQLKTREGELSQLLQQVEAFKRSRLHMSEEIVKLSNQNEKLAKFERMYSEAVKSKEQISRQHNITLSMLGEKQEMIDELKLDVLDLKEMFKAQTERLVSQMNN